MKADSFRKLRDAANESVKDIPMRFTRKRVEARNAFVIKACKKDVYDISFTNVKGKFIIVRCMSNLGSKRYPYYAVTYGYSWDIVRETPAMFVDSVGDHYLKANVIAVFR